MEKIKLCEDEIKEIKKWLKLTDKDQKCPFRVENIRASEVICHKAFPKTKRKPWFPAVEICKYYCPCGYYKLSTVIRYARQMIKDNS